MRTSSRRICVGASVDREWRMMIGEWKTLIRYSPLRYSLCFFLPSYERREAERRQTRSPTAAPYGARRASSGTRSSVGVPPRLSPKGVFHPEDSASGQASWDVVCTGVTRHRLSQSREAPPTPVIMPGDMMPKPPGSGVQIRPQAPHPAPPFSLPPEGVLRESGMNRKLHTEGLKSRRERQLFEASCPDLFRPSTSLPPRSR
jgi:hypothetical protein